ncbi:hypothetical protein PNA2_1356 [Pyrococcus sp. NA2]|uniref:hypothetical protein n=1 Tax=Pyrococcus sp. (strain NA2) TaxID=342949 RepID=UPI000209AE13|nr:hypothetical protein [Pyrococcus sp. NA2]AEC52271.1 hypothetical protein PNA2_1356 [Pyrococcus sp. NA2]
MRIIIKPDKGFGRIKVELGKDVTREILRISEEFGIPIEEVIKLAILGEFKEPSSNVDELEREVKELERKVWMLEKEFAPLKFKAYNLTQENKLLAIELSGLLAENVQLKRFLKRKVEYNKELRKIISYYMGI